MAWFNLIDDFVKLGTRSGRQALKGGYGVGPGIVRGLRGKGWDVSGYSTRGLQKGFLGSFDKAGKYDSPMLLAGWSMFNVPLAAFSAAQAPHGRKMSTFAEGATPLIGTAVATALLGPWGMAVGMLIDPKISQAVGHGVQWLHDFDRNQRRLGTGGDYQDTEAAFTMRQRATSEMSRSLLNARQYLGKESVMLHA